MIEYRSGSLIRIRAYISDDTNDLVDPESAVETAANCIRTRPQSMGKAFRDDGNLSLTVA